MEPEISSLYSQVPATCPYPGSTPSSPHNPLPLKNNLYFNTETQNSSTII